MAIVEDEVRNESEDENEIEVVVEGVETPAETDDSDDEDEDMVLERKVGELNQRIIENPYDYDVYIELIQTLWSLSSLDRWRSTFENLQQVSLLRPEHWLLRLRTEVSLAHNEAAHESVARLFQEATLDCYSIPILSDWCSWSVTLGDADKARSQIEKVLRRAGADPFSGKIFWDAKLELEKAQLGNMRPEDTEYKAQQERVLWCLEEIVSRPLLRGEEALPQLEELALALHDQEYVDKVKQQHEAAVDFLHEITPFEDKLLTLENPDEKCEVFQEYIQTVKHLSHKEKYNTCDVYGILRVLYDRVTSDCVNCSAAHELLLGFARHTMAKSSRSTVARVLQACVRRCPRRATFWSLCMQHSEREDKSFEQIKTIFELALSRGMESYKENEALWMSYLEYLRRHTAPDNDDEVEKLRRTFRLGWDTLAEAWGEEANDCELPLFWARLEYKVLNDPNQGKMIFEEIFKYGENITMSKYWEALISLESNRTPRPSENKLRDLMRRALRSVKDYPPAIARLWTDFERDHGQLDTLRECKKACEKTTKAWRESYQAMKDKMIGNKKERGRQTDYKKSKFDKKKTKEDNKDKHKGKGKRKSDGSDEGSKGKRRKDTDMEVDVKDEDSGGGMKRMHDDDEIDVGESKRQRTNSTSPHRLGTRDACTLFVSNLEFKVDEQNLRDKLSQYGDIISLRVRKGIKAFGGSICYCQYKTPEAVDEALKHDRIPLDGRPMFFSRYSAKKSKPTFKYSTDAEKNKLFVKNLPFAQCTKDALSEVFDKYGKLKDIRVVTHKDGKPKGLAYIEYEEESAAAEAVSKTHGMMLGDRKLDVALSAPPPRQSTSTDMSALGMPKRDGGGGMRRTQLSSFIPSVLQKASTSAARPTSSQANGNSSNEQANGNHSNDDQRPLSNSDFRTLLLKKQ